MKVKRIGLYSNKNSSRGQDFNICINISKNKAMETVMSFDKDPIEWFRICTQLTRKVNNAGFCLSCTIFWFKFEFLLFDKRLWDYKSRKFIELEPEPEQIEFKYF